MKRILLTVAATVAAGTCANAQIAPPAHVDFKITKGATITVSSLPPDWHVQLHNTIEEDVGPEPDKAEMQRIKQYISNRYPAGRGRRAEERMQTVNAPSLLRNFQGNVVNGFVPNDNTMAVSNGNRLITAINSNLYMYDITNDSLLLSPILYDFTPTSLGVPAGSRFDPKAIYDPVADRFILVYLNLNGNTNTTMVSSTRAIIGFSATNDPTGAWNMYVLQGNPVNDTSWTDYPAIAITQDELFLTCNA